MKRILLLVDPQIDFVNGTLAVPGAAKSMDALANWLAQNPSRHSHIIVSGDWHCQNHCSFQENGGKWPTHCVADSPGAQIWPAIQIALEKINVPVTFLRKAETCEEYSVFQNETNKAAINDLVSSEKIDKIDICGIAGDICVLSTLKDALRCFGSEKIEVLPQFSPSLDNGKALADFMAQNNIKQIF